MRVCAHVFLGVLIWVLPLAAQDPLQVDAPHFKVEYEDARVRVLRFRLMPGESSPLHEHAVRITVVVSGSRIRVQDTDGASREVTIYTGFAEREPATRHTVENVGDQPYEELTTEFKDAASQPPRLVVKAPPPPPKPEKVKKEKAEKAKAEKPKEENAPAKKKEPEQPTVAAQPVVSAPASAPASVPSTGQLSKPAATATVATTQPAPAPVAPEPVAPEPVLPEPIIKPLKTRPPDAVMRKTRRAFSAESMREATVNHIRLAFMEEGKGVPVVLVHGAMSDYRTWQLQIPALAKKYHVIAYSRRYHFPNPSTGKEEDYSYEDNIEDLAQFLVALNLGPVHLVGHGYGAAVAAMLAERRPELVRSLTLSEPGFENLLDAKRAYRSHWARDEIYNVIRKPLSKANPEKGIQVYHDWLAETAPWSRLDPQEQYDRKQNANPLRSQTFEVAAPAFVCADAKKIKTPTLVVAGQSRSPNSAEITGTLAACLANSERTTITNSGPAAYFDNADEYNQALLEFLAKH